MNLGNKSNFINVEKIPLFSNIKNNESYIDINTSLNINDIEKKINRILDKKKDLCRYYLDFNQNTFIFSFCNSVVRGDTESILKYSIEIIISKDESNNAVLTVSKDISEVEQWNDIYRELLNLNKI